MADTMALLDALQKADAAGDVESAKHIASIIHANKDTTPAPTIGGPPPTSTPKSVPPSALSSGQDKLQIGPFSTGIPLPSSTADQLAGVGKAFHDIGQGIGQKIGLTSSADVQDTRDRDRDLMSSANGRAGNVMGNLAALAPAALIPGINAGVGAAASGAMLGAMQPSTSLEEQTNSTLGGAIAPTVLGHAIPAAGRALASIPGVKPIGNLVSTLLPGGADRAARRLYNQYAGGQPEINQARASLVAASKDGLAEKYGFKPTSAQLAENAGLAQLDRSLRNNGGEVAGPLVARDEANRDAIHDILTGVSGTAEDRLRAQTARTYDTEDLYLKALNDPRNLVPQPTPSTPDINTATGGGQHEGVGLNDIGVRLQQLMQRPAIKESLAGASDTAANFGIKIDDQNLVQQLHYAKLNLDGKISVAKRAGDSTNLAALQDSKNNLLGVMDELSPAYAEARNTYRQASVPINRMDVGEALRQKYMSGLADFGGTNAAPNAFASSLRNPNADQLARTATGFSGATLQNTLNPDDIEALTEAAKQMGRTSQAQNLGRGIGSNTGQNLVNQRDLDSAGRLSSVTSEGAGPAMISAAMHHPATIPLTFLGNGANHATKLRLGAIAADPDLARAALAPRGPSLVDKYLPSGLMSPTIASAGINQSADAPEGHADGGSVDPQYKKSSFWDLIQQGWKELNAPSAPPTPTPANDGSTPSGTKGADFDKWVQRGVDSNS